MEKRKVAKVSRFQAVSQKSKRDAGLSTIITAKKSFVEAKSICPGCGIRVNRNEMGPCDNCGIQICRSCLHRQRSTGNPGEGKCQS
ncbi:MAG: hypothetical protein ACOXZ5_06960 [Syntrophomonadaceae bacterium]|jgi:hypothetical protein